MRERYQFDRDRPNLIAEEVVIFRRFASQIQSLSWLNYRDTETPYMAGCSNIKRFKYCRGTYEPLVRILLISSHSG